jgi:ABC-type Fe3+ transport system substrate-binding protein
VFKQGIIIFTLLATLVLPFALRPDRETAGKADEKLVIITPHNEAIRHEFGIAFAKWYRERTGKTVALDWRLIGGTTEIAKYLEGEYTAGFRNLWVSKQGKRWSNEVLSGFANGALPPDAPAEAKEARAAFLASDVGCGIDLFYGGGSYDFIRQAQAGRLVDSGILRTHPEWFADEVIPREFAGEVYWDKDGLWVGTVLSSFGIIANKDSLARLGVETPRAWADLADPRYAGEVALADPTKSGSIAKAFENVVQQQMQRVVNERMSVARFANEEARKAAEARAVAEGWTEGIKLLQKIGANARYFTDSAQKVPIDVAAGDCAVGMGIDFFGRQQQEAVRRRGANDRLTYVSPEGGAVASVDPVGILRGAPNKAAAVAFIEYSLTMEGQKLWNLKPGVEGGPEYFALRRLPVRKDFYEIEGIAELRSDPGELPYAEQADRLIYRPEWTGRFFRELAFTVRVMCLDTQPELKRAWRALIDAGMPAEALAVFEDVSAVAYQEAGGRIKAALRSKNKVDEIKLANELGNKFRAQYLKVVEMAEKSGKGEKS